jgi:nicotinamide mononucleotide adenylyltransferase
MTNPTYANDIAVCIGRFQVFHHAQLALLRRALQSAPECVVVLGSAFQARWVAAVKQGVAQFHPGHPSVLLVGHQKDATSAYLRDFPGWTLDDAGSQGDIHASDLRDAYFAAQPATVPSTPRWSGAPYPPVFVTVDASAAARYCSSSAGDRAAGRAGGPVSR